MALALLDGKVLRFDRQQRVKGDSNGVGEVKNLFFGRGGGGGRRQTLTYLDRALFTLRFDFLY